MNFKKVGQEIRKINDDFLKLSEPGLEPVIIAKLDIKNRDRTIYQVFPGLLDSDGKDTLIGINSYATYFFETYRYGLSWFAYESSMGVGKSRVSEYNFSRKKAECRTYDGAENFAELLSAATGARTILENRPDN
jgi:hypothetical protein